MININKIAAYDVGEHLLFMSFINPTGFFDNLRPRVSIRSGTVSAFLINSTLSHTDSHKRPRLHTRALNLAGLWMPWNRRG